MKTILYCFFRNLSNGAYTICYKNLKRHWNYLYCYSLCIFAVSCFCTCHRGGRNLVAKHTNIEIIPSIWKALINSPQILRALLPSCCNYEWSFLHLHPIKKQTHKAILSIATITPWRYFRNELKRLLDEERCHSNIKITTVLKKNTNKLSTWFTHL